MIAQSFLSKTRTDKLKKKLAGFPNYGIIGTWLQGEKDTQPELFTVMNFDFRNRHAPGFIIVREVFSCCASCKGFGELP